MWVSETSTAFGGLDFLGQPSGHLKLKAVQQAVQQAVQHCSRLCSSLREMAGAVLQQ